MVWGGIFHNQKTDLVFIDETLNAQRYMDQVINAAVVPLFAAQPQLTLMHDGATPHTARAVGQHLANPGIAVLPWTSKSPDLNPIEHLWDELERRLRARQHEPATLAELRRALEEEWAAIPQERVRRLIVSMRARCGAVVAANGGHTANYFFFFFIFN